MWLRALPMCLFLTGCFLPTTDPTPQNGTDLGSSTVTGLGLIEIAAAENFETGALVASLTAAFFQQPSVCTTKTSGSCIIQHCPAGTPAITYHPAGPLTITGTQRNYTLNPSDSGAYGGVDQSGLPFLGGEIIKLSAAGGAEVPAFTIAGVAPYQVAVTEPVVLGGALSISTSQALAVSWSGTPGGDVVGALTRFSQAGEATTAACRFDGLLGVGQIPVDVIGSVAAAGGETITFGVISRNQVTLKVGTYNVQLNLSFAPSNVSSGAVTFTP